MVNRGMYIAITHSEVFSSFNVLYIPIVDGIGVKVHSGDRRQSGAYCEGESGSCQL